MVEDHLSGMKARNGTCVFVCSTCRVPPNFTFGAKPGGALSYLMLCPKCGCVLGEWDSIEARRRVLSELVRGWKAPSVGACRIEPAGVPPLHPGNKCGKCGGCFSR